MIRKFIKHNWIVFFFGGFMLQLMVIGLIVWLQPVIYTNGERWDVSTLVLSLCLLTYAILAYYALEIMDNSKEIKDQHTIESTINKP